MRPQNIGLSEHFGQNAQHSGLEETCTIVTPFGPFQYNRVPMGLVNSPAFAQSRMEEVLRGTEDTHTHIYICIDNIGIFSNS